jgi:hypothetical protein
MEQNNALLGSITDIRSGNIAHFGVAFRYGTLYHISATKYAETCTEQRKETWLHTQ